MSATLPADLLHAVSERAGRVALILGAGCSLEQPTGLELSRVYAQGAHERLVLDGVLEAGDCDDPTDLSRVADAVFTKTGSQADVVRRLPRSEFRLARPNSGYLAAAALLREGVINAVLTLNFDLAMTEALTQVGATDIALVEGPTSTSDLGRATLIYLHRNVNEPDLDAWILRAEALEREWQGGWQQVVVQRVLSCPVVVFAGLGSRAAALTETVSLIRQAVASGQHHVFVVDPSPTSEFESELDPPPQGHVQAGWCSFMASAGERFQRVLEEEMRTACADMCTAHGWEGEADYAADLAQRLHSSGLVGIGSIRAAWLMTSEPYTPDDARRPMVADLLLGVGLIERSAATTADFRTDGSIVLDLPSRAPLRLKPASGGGALRWSAMEPAVAQVVRAMPRSDRPSHVLVSGIVGGRPDAAPPEDLIEGNLEHDIVTGFSGPTIVTVDEVRENPQIVTELLG